MLRKLLPCTAALLLLVSLSLHAQTVPSPQQTDQIISDPNGNGKADPGDKIRYKVTIQNTGGPTATGTTLNAVPDLKTTFSPGSFRSSPLAFDDGPYTCIGNVGITVPDGASDLLANDFDDAPGGLTCSPVTNAATTAGGTITINANGSFSYNPPRGYEGSDTYTYTVNDGNAVAGVTATSTATVTITVSGMIWFINNNAGACASSCDGRMSNPYTSLADFNTANALAGGLDPADNENIFVYESATAYTGGITLRSGQKLFGQDATVTLLAATGLTQPTFGNTLPVTNSANGTIANITNASGEGVTLNSGNTLRGFTVSSTSGTKIIGSGFGTLSVQTVSLLGSGAALNLTNGMASVNIPSFASTSSTTAVILNNVSGTLSLLGTSGGISGATTSAIVVTGGSVDMTYNPGITHAGTGPMVSVSGGHTGTLSFQSFGLSATAGTGLQFDNADGTYNFNVGTTLNGGAAAVSITNGSSGTFSFSGAANIANPSSTAFSILNSNATVTYNGDISKTSAGFLIDIDNHAAGTVTFQGTPATLSSTGSSSGIRVQNNSGGTVNFGSSTKTLNTGANTAVTLATNTGAAINFTGGGLAITTTSGTGFNATGGGTVTVQGTGNTISSTTGTALNVVSTTIGASGLTFQSISANGGANGIVLDNTGSSGSLTVTGNNNTSVGGDNSGGTIQNTTGHGISLTNTLSPSFTNINIQSTARSGIDGQQVTNFTLKSSTINNSGTGAAGQHEESNVAFNDGGTYLNTNLSGTVSITKNVLNNARRHGIQISNGNGTISNLTISDNSLTSSTVSTTSLGTGIQVDLQGSASTASHLTTGTISNNTVSFFPSAGGIEVLGGSGSGTNNTNTTLGANGTPVTISGNTIGGTSGTRMGSNAIRVSFNGQFGVMNFSISSNNSSYHEGQGISYFVGGTVTGTGTISNNTIAAHQTIGAGTQGLAVQVDDGPAAAGTSAADYNISISGNTVSNYEGSGIRAIARASLGKLDVTILNNKVGTPLMTNRNAIRVDGGSTVGDTYLCLDMSGNTNLSNGALTGSGVNAGIGLRKQGTVATTNDFGIVGITANPSNAQVQAYVGNPRNNSADGSSSVNGVDIISGSSYISCTQTP